MIFKVQGDSYLFIPKDSVHDSLTGIKSPEDKQKKGQEGVVTMMHLKFTASINLYIYIVKRCWKISIIWVFPKIVVPPNHPI